MFEIEDDPEQRMIIKVVGIGRKGARAVGKMSSCIPDVEFLVIPEGLESIQWLSANGEIHSLDSIASERAVGSDSTGGKAIEDSFAELFDGTELVVIVTGMENKAVTDISANFAQVAGEAGAFTVIVTDERPSWKGRGYNIEDIADFDMLSSRSNSFLSLSINSLMPLDDGVPLLLSEPALIDHLMRHAVGKIVQCVTERGIICLDFADVKEILGNCNSTYLGIGIANGTTKGKDATVKAVQGLSRQGFDVTEATGILVIVEGSTNMTMDDFEQAGRVFVETIPEETNIIFGCFFDDAFGDNLKVTVFASFSRERRRRTGHCAEALRVISDL